MTDNENSINWLNLGLSCITRILFWGSTIFTLYLCVGAGYSLLVLHIAAFTIGCILLMVEATLVVTGDAVLAAYVSKENRIRVHWILHTLGVAAIIVGLVTIGINKDEYGIPHYTSNHARVGIAASVLGIFVALAAIPTLYRKMLPQEVNFGAFKRTHIYLGIVSLILLWAGQFTGFYTSWWASRTSTLTMNLNMAACAIGGFCLLAKPLYSTLWRSFH